MLIMAEGSYEFKDYIRTGVPLVVIMVMSLSFLLAFWYGLPPFGDGLVLPEPVNPLDPTLN